MYIIKGGSKQCPRALIWAYEGCLWGMMESEQFTDRGGEIEFVFNEGRILGIDFLICFREEAEWMLKPHEVKFVKDSIEIWDLTGKYPWLLTIIHVDAFHDDIRVYERLRDGKTVNVELFITEEK